MTTHRTDAFMRDIEVYLLPVQMRTPLKFGRETIDRITCLRVRLLLENKEGRSAWGWGESPLSVAWAWPSDRSYKEREDILLRFCKNLAEAFSQFPVKGHPIEIGIQFQKDVLPGLLSRFPESEGENVPHLASLICLAPFDLALHDAFGCLWDRPVYSTYNQDFMNRDLSGYLEGEAGVSFSTKYPVDFFASTPARRLPVWHLVGAVDPLDEGDVTGSRPDDGYPVTLREWIRTDGLTCLKIKLRGTDADWDYERLVQVGRLAREEGCRWLSTDFNCTVETTDYVHDVLDRLEQDHADLYAMILYVEQPFPYELEESLIDVHDLSARRDLFLDESAHDWKMIRLGRRLGWNGVALKTCKTQTGAIFSGCWAAAHGMKLMVQDLTNPMLAQISHVQLAAHFPTIMGVESNAPQFYPAASAPEAAVHPGLYARRNGMLTLDTVTGPGFGYRIDEIKRALPERWS